MIKQSYGLIGYPLEHSLSNVLHDILFKLKKAKCDYTIMPVEIKDLSEKLDILRHTLNGFNVTIPYKTTILDYLDYVDNEAKIIGAVNTLKTNEGFLNGYNTDIEGIDYTFKKDSIEVKKKSALVIGYGGAALSAVYYLKRNGAKSITVTGRDMQKLIDFQKNYSYKNDIPIDIASIKNITGSFQIVINCTPAGMSPHFDEMPININKIADIEYYFDTIYNPRKTLLLKNFEEKNIRCRDGLLMLVVQAARAQEIWNKNIKFSYDEIEKAYFELALYMFKSLAVENINVISLTGFMGCGKTTVGKKLASLLGFTFIDTDLEIEKKYGSINMIFKTEGENKFREYETEILKSVLKNKNVVISTGGGIIEKNSKLIKDKTFNIYLECDFFELSKRAYNKSRPLFKNLDETEELYKKRLPFYEKNCHLKINSADNIQSILLNIFSSI